MGEYIKHSTFSEEVKLGVYRGSEIECNYPHWALEKFLNSNYEPKHIIQRFLDDADQATFPDYKQFDSSPLLQIYFSNSFEGEQEQKLIDELIGEGYTIAFDEKGQLVLVTTEYGKPFVEDTCKRHDANPWYVSYNKKVDHVIQGYRLTELQAEYQHLLHEKEALEHDFPLVETEAGKRAIQSAIETASDGIFKMENRMYVKALKGKYKGKIYPVIRQSYEGYITWQADIDDDHSAHNYIPYDDAEGIRVQFNK